MRGHPLRLSLTMPEIPYGRLAAMGSANFLALCSNLASFLLGRGGGSRLLALVIRVRFTVDGATHWAPEGACNGQLRFQTSLEAMSAPCSWQAASYFFVVHRLF